MAFSKVRCPTCKHTFPLIERLYQQFRAQRVQTWGISQGNARGSRPFARGYGASILVPIDDYPYKTLRAYGLEYVPTLFLIDPNGRVKLVSEGLPKAGLVESQVPPAKHFSVTLCALFHASDRAPEFKPGWGSNSCARPNPGKKC